MIFLLFSLKCDDREGHRFCEVDTETIFTVALFNQRYWAIKWRGRFFNNGRFLYYTSAPKEKGIHDILVCVFVCLSVRYIFLSNYLPQMLENLTHYLFRHTISVDTFLYQSMFPHSRRIYKYFLCLTNVMVDLSVQTIVLVTVTCTTCEIHLKKLIHLKILEFANSLTHIQHVFTFDVTLYLVN